MKKATQKSHTERFPYDAAPTAKNPDELDGCLEQVNRYGTYNVQATNDTDNVFPAIAQGLPKELDPYGFSMKKY